MAMNDSRTGVNERDSDESPEPRRVLEYGGPVDPAQRLRAAEVIKGGLSALVAVASVLWGLYLIATTILSSAGQFEMERGTICALLTLIPALVGAISAAYYFTGNDRE